MTDRDVCSPADVQEIRLETSYWLSGRPGWLVVHRVQSACAKLRQVPQSVQSPAPFSPPPRPTPLLNRSFFFSRYSVSPLSSIVYPFPPPLPFFPDRAYIRVFLFLHAVAVASAPSSLATQTSINFAGSGPTVFQFRVSTMNASALDRQGSVRGMLLGK